MVFALFLQYAVDLQPCPLCIVQRVAVIFVAFICLVAAIHNAKRTGKIAYAVIALLVSLFGMATAARQIFLQHLPKDQLPACLPSLDYMMGALPFKEIVRLVLTGTADCGEIQWTFLTLSIPEWSFLSFFGMAALMLVILFLKKKNTNALS
ncbi:UNVERIFIED_CONTAM: hypothetical protein GTU68_060412 [Idotea baltica]|nr:hypothetical protein [Idotea baltica]